MSTANNIVLGLAAALGAGLLIGVERERRKGSGAKRGIAGVRTFTLAALAGAGAAVIGQPMLSIAGALFIAVLVSIGYWRNRSGDPGVTTELALLVTYLIGIMAIDHPSIAAGCAVVVTLLLASRRLLHELSVDVLTETELRDGLVFAAAALVLLPLLPEQFSILTLEIKLRRLWGLVVLFMTLQALSYIALRIAGPRFGLALSGLASGFVTSTGTIAALGARAREAPHLRTSCVAGALSSTVATVILLGVVVLAVFPPAFSYLTPMLLAALIAALISAAVPLWQQRDNRQHNNSSGRAFNLLHAIVFACGLTAITTGISLINTYLGGTAAATATAVAGAFDVHAAATSTLLLASGDKLNTQQVMLTILVAFSANTIMKMIAAFVGGGRVYGMQVASGLILIAVAAWLPFLLLRK